MAKASPKLMLSLTGIALIALGATYFFAFNEPAPKSDPAAAKQTTEKAKPAAPKPFVASKNGELPNFAVIADVKQKKQEFFGYLQPMVEKENARILTVRSKVTDLKEKSSLSSSDQSFLNDLAKKYKLANDESGEWTEARFDQLLVRLDVVPASLTLAQAANESAWGTSRFAREANNLFGQWCFTKGCGVVPKSRDAGKSHEVAKFKSVQASVNAYIYNLNSSNAYKELRNIRRILRYNGQPISGQQLAKGLEKYSERGHEYVEEIQSMIRVNKLSTFDVATR